MSFCVSRSPQPSRTFSVLFLIINVSAQSKSSCTKHLNCSRLWNFTLKIKVLLVLSEVSLFTWPCVLLPQRGIHNVILCRSILSWCNMTDGATLVKLSINLKSLKDNGLNTEKSLLNSNIHACAIFLLSLHFISQMERLHQIWANTQFAFVPEKPSRFGTITDNCACSHEVWHPEPPRRYTSGRQPMRSGHSVFGNNISPCSRASAETAAHSPQSLEFVLRRDSLHRFWLLKFIWRRQLLSLLLGGTRIALGRRLKWMWEIPKRRR